MKLFGTALLASAVVAEYDYYEGERGKKKGSNGKKPVKRDACGCDLNPRNAPDAVPTCVDDSQKRKIIDWTCAATGLFFEINNDFLRKGNKGSIKLIQSFFQELLFEL